MCLSVTNELQDDGHPTLRPIFPIPVSRLIKGFINAVKILDVIIARKLELLLVSRK